jgi:lycopene cyclase domain-containing protein
MSTYGLINLVIISIPLALTWWRPVSYYQKFPHIAKSILLVGSFFIIWNMLAVSRGHWSWNPDYVMGKYLASLPVEEWLFFITVPYSSLFIYENLRIFIKKRVYQGSLIFPLLATLGMLVVALFNLDHEYTAIVLVLTGSANLVAVYFYPFLFRENHVHMYLVLGFVTFFIFNTLLTALPVLIYGSPYISGIRIGTIPIEDFLYNYLLLASYVVVYKSSLCQKK